MCQSGQGPTIFQLLNENCSTLIKNLNWVQVYNIQKLKRRQTSSNKETKDRKTLGKMLKTTLENQTI